jgi:phosphoglycerate kinase
LQDPDVDNKIVLLRGDHNVVKKGLIEDPFRIDQTIGTIFNIVERGGRPIIMTHIGRPRDKAGKIKVDKSTGVPPIAEYLERKLHTKIYAIIHAEGIRAKGHRHLDKSRHKKFKAKKFAHLSSGLREVPGEESKTETVIISRDNWRACGRLCQRCVRFWQPHVSPIHHEVSAVFRGIFHAEGARYLAQVLQPERPFISVVAAPSKLPKIGRE